MLTVFLLAVAAWAATQAYPVSKDDPAIHEAGCDAGSPTACFELAGQYELGVRVTEDAARAAQLYDRACRGGEARGCLALARLNDDGHGVAKDPALALYDQACTMGAAVGCSISP